MAEARKLDALIAEIKELDKADDPVMSVAKLSPDELKAYTDRLNGFLHSPGLVAIRICECCINISIS
jgi:hypothetical protein